MLAPINRDQLKSALKPYFGGPEEDRTPDLLNANQALSQLSYRPDKWWAQVDSNH